MDKASVVAALQKAARYADAGADDTKTATILRTLAERIESGQEREGYTALMEKVSHTLTIDWSPIGDRKP